MASRGYSWIGRLCAILLVALVGACGRIGVALIPLPAVGPDAGAPCVGDACEPVTACDEPVVSPSEGVCGCGRPASDDADRDGIPDCLDLCPGIPDQLSATACACPAAQADADRDGVANCLDGCPFDSLKSVPGACGCGMFDADADRDGTPDCHDECPSDQNKTRAGLCGCARSDQDTDLDGTPDCLDDCSGQSDEVYTSDDSCGVGYCRAHNVPSTCSQGVETACRPGAPAASEDTTCDNVDDDCDGRVDEGFASVDTTCGQGACAATGRTRCENGRIVDSCSAATPTSTDDASCNNRDDDCDANIDEDVLPVPSSCAMGACSMTGVIACVGGVLVDSCQASAPTAASDVTCDNVDDDCDGRVDEDYVEGATSCGVGVCARSGTRRCISGNAIDSCSPGAAQGSDASCNNQDDDCDGRVDEAYVTVATSCGTGACASTGSARCVAGVTQDSCVPKAPTTTVDDATSPGNNIDDDCDGRIDEDLASCDTTPRTFEAGAHDNIVVPGDCQHVTVRLWGGGGASGQTIGTIIGGNGGAGGYATASALISGPISLYIGGGASSGCNAAGTNAGSAMYNGGSGGPAAGDNGADGSAAGGGTGGKPSAGKAGGDGHYGGGGGGESGAETANSGDGGGGGAASVFIVNGVRVALAGGGGGGGGALSILGGLVTGEGGKGGSGCGGNGLVATPNGGGGGGGGACQGASVQGSSGVAPAFSSDIPSGRASGASGSCSAGGAGYAIVTFGP